MTLDLAHPGAHPPTSRPAVDEDLAIRSVELQLQAEFPTVPPEQVSILVECLWSHYDGASVRDFVAVLVRKQAREELSDHWSAPGR